MVGILLAHDDSRLHGIRKKMSGMSIPRKIHKATAVHATSHSWSFVAWGIDIVGSFEKATARGYKYILAATDYFSK